MMTVGTLHHQYSIDGINGGPDQTISVNVPLPQREFTFNFIAIPLWRHDNLTIQFHQNRHRELPISAQIIIRLLGLPVSHRVLEAWWKLPLSLFLRCHEVTIQFFGNELGEIQTSTQWTLIQVEVFIVFTDTDVCQRSSPSVCIAITGQDDIKYNRPGMGRIVIKLLRCTTSLCSGLVMYSSTDSVRIYGDQFYWDVSLDCSGWMDWILKYCVWQVAVEEAFGESPEAGGRLALLVINNTGFTWMRPSGGLFLFFFFSYKSIFQMSPGGGL